MNNALAMHGITYPSDRVPGCLDGMDVAGKMVIYLKPMMFETKTQ